MVFNKPMDALKTYVAEHGLTPLARTLGCSVQRLSNWLDRGVPIDMCAAVEIATSKRVRRWDLRPADWAHIWPELVGSEGAPEPKLAEAQAEQGVA